MEERIYPFNIIEYNVEVEDELTEYNISYTNENGQIRRVNEVKGSWRKLVVIPKQEIPLHLSTVSSERMNSQMGANIQIDGKIIKEEKSKLGIVNLLHIKK